MRIGLIGDYRADVRAHAAIPKALELAAHGRRVQPVWLPTPELETRSLQEFAGLWCVPNSPYESMAGALRAIHYARELRVAFLGTCGGFQHALIEYARSVLGIAAADHAESNPEAETPLITRLQCSLLGMRGHVRLAAGSRAAAIMGAETEEAYHCNFGLNAKCAHLFTGSRLKITGIDEAGEPRVAELGDHPFFICTLFQPELTALEGREHPLIRAFVDACLA